jgi:hypothetical protein
MKYFFSKLLDDLREEMIFLDMKGLPPINSSF